MSIIFMSLYCGDFRPLKNRVGLQHKIYLYIDKNIEFLDEN